MRAELGRLKYCNYLAKDNPDSEDSDEPSSSLSTSNKKDKNSDNQADVLKELEKIRSEVKPTTFQLKQWVSCDVVNLR